MTYNKAPRRSLTTLQRARLFEGHGGICYLCGEKIKIGEAWEDEHIIARELGGSDDWDNRAPAHVGCHKPKTAEDRKLIAKSNRVRANHIGAKQPSRLRSAGFQKSAPQRTASRPFQKREKASP